ncbi:MAG: hypothetical protein Q8L48_05175 [Archangium sp.]|nr:hypothetical protein [Archangium sp.]
MRLALVFASLFISACGPLTFTTEMKGDATIAGSPFGQLLSAFPQAASFASIDFSQNQDFKNNNTSRDKVKTTKVTALSLKIVSPNSQDFGFLDSLEFSVKAGDKTQKIATKTDIASLGLAAPNPTLNLDLIDADLGEYVRSSGFSIITSGAGRKPAQDTQIEINVKFLVGVGL